MTVETFFQKFDQFADAPNAVSKMRELVLYFAITGRLAESLAEDAPVSELLDALSSAKARFKSVRRALPRVVEAESIYNLPILIPQHWVWIPLNEIGAMSGGMTPSKGKTTFWDGDVNWFSSKDIKTDELMESQLRITRAAIEATRLKIYSPGCIVMVARSGILKRTFPVSILRARGTVNQDLKVLSPYIDGLERYLQIMLRGLTSFILTSLVKTGMTVQSLKYEEFEAQAFPLPPLAEQKRIVAKVDELMALCDQLEQQQQEREIKHTALARASLARFAKAPTPVNLNFLFHKSYEISPEELRKAILTLAVRGNLVPQDPNDEMALAVAKNELFVSESKSVAPFDIPPRWSWAQLGQLANINGGFAFKSTDYTETGTRVIRISDFDEFGFKDHKIVRHSFPPELRRFALEAGDILMAMTGGTVGKSFYVRSLPEPMLVNQRVATIKVLPEAESSYIDLLIRSELTQQVIRDSKNSTNDNISMGDIKTFVVPLPPLAEQRRIVAAVDTLMAMVDNLEAQLSSRRDSAEKLLEAVVHELTNVPRSAQLCQ